MSTHHGEGTPAGNQEATPTAGSGELSLLLDWQRQILTAGDAEALGGALGRALEGLFPWVAYTLVPDPAGGAVTRVHGGRRLHEQARRQFAGAVQDEARRLGSSLEPLSWHEVEDSGTEALAGELLSASFPADHGQQGFILVLTAAAGPVPDRTRRLLSALSQQAGSWMQRWGGQRRRHHEDIQALMESLDAAVLVLAADGRVTACNAAGSAMARRLLDHDLLVGKSLEELGLPLPGLAFDGATEFSGLRDQGRYTARRVVLPAGEGETAVVLQDVTAQRGSSEQVRQAEKMTVLGEMLSGVAHELNNPLATVMGFSQLLRAQSTDAAVRQRLGVIVDEAERARRIVSNLLDVARVRPAEKVSVSLEELVQGILGLFAYAFRVDGIEVEWQAAPQLPPVLGDRGRLQQVMVNLLSNAHHAMRQTPAPRRLRIMADEREGRIRLQVQDSGAGIPESHLDKIFAPFFTTKEAGAGTGLGLAICARIVDEHGGGIHVQSGAGGGATFILDLPAAASPVAVEGTTGAGIAAAAPVGRLLVVEDEEAFRQLLQEALAGDGLEVETAADGLAALALMESRRFDYVVSDVRMPGMNGMELHAEVARRWPALARRFVFMTGDVMDPEVRNFLAAAQVPHLPKPFSLPELEQALQHLVADRDDMGSPVLDCPGDPPHETST